VVDAPDDPAAVRAGLEPSDATRTRDDHFDLSHARRPSLRTAAFALYLTRMRMAGGAGGRSR
jgi:hypothetical protein